MKERSTRTAGDDARYTTRVTLRLMPEEYEHIRLFADRYGCTLSQAVRLIIFGNGGDSGAKNSRSRERNNDVSALARKVREDFKRIAEEYASVAESYRRNLSPDNARQTVRVFRCLQDMTIDLQKSVNAYLSVAGVKETHAAARIALPEACTDDGDEGRMTENEHVLYCHMETMELIGFLEKDASVYTRKKEESDGGRERMVLSVYCMRRRKTRNIRIAYTVFADRTGILDYLKSGKQVYARGRFEENEKGDKVIFADTVKLLGEKEQED